MYMKLTYEYDFEIFLFSKILHICIKNHLSHLQIMNNL